LAGNKRFISADLQGGISKLVSKKEHKSAVRKKNVKTDFNGLLKKYLVK
jgi:hypothetical protein